MPSYKGWSVESAQAVIDSHAGEDGAMLPVLHDLQLTFGYIPRQAVPLVADALNVSRAEVHGVISFYHYFRESPPGRHVLRLCRSEACQALGATRVANYARARLGLDWHETTADGALTLEPVYCLGLCACGPSAMVDERPLARLDEQRLDALIEAAR